MSGQIRLRAWNQDKQEFEWFVFGKNGHYTHSVIVPASENGIKDWSRWTGLTDINGVDIYEGDIVERQKIARGRKNGTVKWVVGWQLDNTHNGWNVWQKTKDQIEVIGNIYRNPELIGN